MKHSPEVSLLLPVYNGQKYLDKAIDSVIKQTFADFEFLISDNGSTDRTEEICRYYSKIDSRIRYFRNYKNMGAARNFNILFDKCHGEYFKWVAHDDICDHEYLSKCVEILDKNPEIILCYSKVKVIDEKGRFIKNYKFKLNGESEKVYNRIRYQIRGHQCYEIFGLIRKKALRHTSLIGDFAGGDAVLLLKLCLKGKFFEIPEYLFYSRRHSKQSTVMQKNMRKFAIWFDPKNKQKLSFPYWRIFFEYMKSVKQAEITIYERLICYLWVVGWWVKRSKLLLKDIVIATVTIFATTTNKQLTKLNGQ